MKIIELEKWNPSADDSRKREYAGQRTAQEGSEQRLLILRRNNLQQIPLIAAFVDTDALLREADQLVLRLLQLQIVHKKAPVNRTGVEQKLMGRDGKQGLCAGQRTAQEVFEELKHRLEIQGYLPDEYFLLDSLWENGREI